MAEREKPIPKDMENLIFHEKEGGRTIRRKALDYHQDEAMLGEMEEEGKKEYLELDHDALIEKITSESSIKARELIIDFCKGYMERLSTGKDLEKWNGYKEQLEKGEAGGLLLEIKDRIQDDVNALTKLNEEKDQGPKDDFHKKDIIKRKERVLMSLRSLSTLERLLWKLEKETQPEMQVELKKELLGYCRVWIDFSKQKHDYEAERAWLQAMTELENGDSDEMWNAIRITIDKKTREFDLADKRGDEEEVKRLTADLSELTRIQSRLLKELQKKKH